jgi:hypothetical protein
VLDARRERLVRTGDFGDRRDFVARAFVLTDDFFGRDRRALVSPFSRRILFTVRDATSSARAPYRPDFFALCLIFSYCRSRFGLAPLGIESSLRNC